VRNVLDLIKFGESETVEFKRSFDREVIETAVAMANRRGGYIIVGVRDDGEIIGVTLQRNTMVEWINEISQNTEPRIIPEIDKFEVNGKQIVVISVDESPIKPVMYRGRAYLRVNASNRKLGSREISELFEMSTGMSWDHYEVEASMADIDLDAVREFAKMARLNYGEGEILKKLHLVRDGKITRAALLLFGKEPQDVFMNAVVRVGRFKDSEIVDSVDVGGNLFRQVESVMEAVKKHLNRRFVIEDVRRKEVWDYPLNALREGIINAIIHRDYRRPEEIQIKIYDDHITIWNPGELPYDLKVEDLYREHHSHPRNKLIAEVFYLAGYIEKWGSGTLRILNAFKNAGLPEPRFEERGGGILLTFWKDIYNEDNLRKMGLNERQIKAVIYVKEHGRISNAEYQNITGIKKRQATEDLRILEEKGIFEKHGTTGRGTYYTIKGHKTGKRGMKGAPNGQKRGKNEVKMEQKGGESDV